MFFFLGLIWSCYNVCSAFRIRGFAGGTAVAAAEHTYFLDNLCARHVLMMQLWRNRAKKGSKKEKGGRCRGSERANKRTNERTGTKQYDLNHGKSGLYVELCVCVCVQRTRLSLLLMMNCTHHRLYSQSIHGFEELNPPVIRVTASVLLIILIKTRRI